MEHFRTGVNAPTLQLPNAPMLKTRQIDTSHTRSYTYPWRNDFAAARNFALEKATTSMIFSLDADEWIDNDGRRRLQAIDNEPANRAYYTRLIDNGIYALDQIKIFPNHSEIRYIGRVHEQIAPSIAKLNIPFFHSGINVS